jgi:hypothetical protein
MLRVPKKPKFLGPSLCCIASSSCKTREAQQHNWRQLSTSWARLVLLLSGNQPLFSDYRRNVLYARCDHTAI